MWTEVAAGDSLPSYSVFTGDIEKPSLDDRHYRVVKLNNGLAAILVHDELADKAAACVTIAVGHLQDPPDMQGTAHFCEHMLSKGSEPYPAENDFISFITSNGGLRNAGTAAAYQNYWFSIGSSLLVEALPRLAAFFHSPLFTPSVTAREIHAVDLENKRNLQKDGRRLLQLLKGLSVAGHPFSNFGTGNFVSLTAAARQKLEKDGQFPLAEDDNAGDGGPIGRETRRRLMEWWAKEYCAGRMTLAIIGKESLDELTTLAVYNFSPILNLALTPRPVIAGPVWGSSQMGSIVFATTVTDYYSFSLTFLLPDQWSYWKAKPTRVITHFLGHEGPGSICAYLKAKNWLIDLSATTNSRNRSVQTFQIEGQLTKEGYLHYRETILAIYNYISILQTSNIERYHYNEISTMSELHFRFREKTKPHAYVNNLSYKLSELCPGDVLSGETVIREWNESLFKETLSKLVPERGRVLLTAKVHEDAVVGHDNQWESEKWYGTKYRVKMIEESFIIQARSPNQNESLFLPRPNPFIPTNLQVRRRDTPQSAKFPACVRQTLQSVLWYKKDDQFWVPKAVVKVDIRSPIAYTTPRHAVLTRLLVDLLEDALAEITYDADLAGVGYSINNHRKGITISVSGYNDKLPILLDMVVNKLKYFQVKPARLSVISEKIRQSYENFYLSQPSVLSDHYTSCLLTPIVWTARDKLAEIPFIQSEDVQRHKEDLLAKVYLEELVVGNMDLQQAIDISKRLEKQLSARVLPLRERPRDRSFLLPDGCNFVSKVSVTDPQELNSSLTFYCQFGNISDNRLRPILSLIVHLIREPCFSQLRTVEQLGYIVACSEWESAGSMGLGIKIQSLKAPSFLEERVETFLQSFRQRLTTMTDDQFEAQKQGLVVKKLEQVKNLREEASQFWRHISDGYYNFMQDELDASTIRNLTLEEILNTYDRLVCPSSNLGARKKLSTHLTSKQFASIISPLSGEASTYNIIVDEETFKAGLLCSTSAIRIPSASDSLYGTH